MQLLNIGGNSGVHHHVCMFGRHYEGEGRNMPFLIPVLVGIPVVLGGLHHLPLRPLTFTLTGRGPYGAVLVAAPHLADKDESAALQRARA